MIVFDWEELVAHYFDCYWLYSFTDVEYKKIY